jgi:hypothetical protein
MSNRMRSPHAKLYAAILLISVITVGIAPRSIHAQAAACVQEIVVQRGQTLTAIATRLLGTQDGVADIIAATNAQAAVDASYTTINDPNAVEAGWKICIPEATSDNTPVTPTRRSLVESTTAMNNRVNNSKSQARAVDVTLEENDKLLQSMLEARLDETGTHPLTIEYLRRQEYPGSPLTIEETLPAGSNYRQYLVSYQSEGLRLYAAMTVPNGQKPASGWPVIIFNHGYIDPALYNSTERYTEHIDAIARNGYIVLRPDLRGHANSQGEALGAYGDPGYTIDVLNALASIKQYADADPNRIGM